MWCDYQPRPLYFVWSFLIAGLIRFRTTVRAAVTPRTPILRHIAEFALVDIIAFRIFAAAAATSLTTVSGVVGAWLISLAIAHPLRALVAQRAAAITTTPHSPISYWQRVSTLHAMGVLAGAAASSSLVLLLSCAVLKLELQERGASLEAAKYSWHISTFFLGVAFTPACAAGDTIACDVAHPGSADKSTSLEAGDITDSSAGGLNSAGLHGVALQLMTSRRAPASAPFAASALVVGALGVPPRISFSCIVRSAHTRRPAMAPPQRDAHADGLLYGILRDPSPPLRLTTMSFAALILYASYIRLAVAPEASAGPFVVATCEDEFRHPLRSSRSAVAAALAADEEYDEDEVERLTFGVSWTLLSLMYGSRSVAVPYARCKAAVVEAGEPASIGLVLAADGSQAKYADPVYVALHNIRKLQQSQLPAEVLHVGRAEQFPPSAVARLAALGRVSVHDMLPRLHPRIRSVAATRLRSFASKPFALLAAACEQCILIDANALFFAPPESLLQLSSYRRTGVQLFNDYLAAYRVLDPWLISSYLGAGDVDVEAYRGITQGAEIDSSVVVLDKRRAWRYLHVVCALNWWKPLLDRHTWGDKDTWALAAVALAPSGDGLRHAGARGSTVGWLARASMTDAHVVPSSTTTTAPPQAVWGHVQFADGGSPNGTTPGPPSLLYLNWQPHYAAGYIELQPRGGGPPGAGVSCCVMLRDHAAGPHDEQPLWPTIPPGEHAPVLARTFHDARLALSEVDSPLAKPHWWGQVRYRRCAIYFAVLTAGCAYALLSAVRAARPVRPREAGKEDDG